MGTEVFIDVAEEPSTLRTLPGSRAPLRTFALVVRCVQAGGCAPNREHTDQARPLHTKNIAV
jgi:hypothetical protein